MSVQLLESAVHQVTNAEEMQFAVVSFDDAQIQQAKSTEFEALGRAVPKRMQEFSVGRHTARLALAKLGYRDAEILIGKHREPLAPAGSLLSITHDDQHAIAIVADTRHYLGLGVDIADVRGLDPALIHSICRGSDLEGLAPGETLMQRAKLVFCLKEALFKAIFPQVRQWMDFSQSELCVDHETGSFNARIFNANGELLVLKGEWRGRFVKSAEGRWIAFAALKS